MASKENYCYRILKSHSLIVDFEGEPTRKNLPEVIKGETFKQWKKRVLGENITNVVVYTPDEPAPQTRISTLQDWSGAQHLEKIFSAFGKAKDKKKAAAIADTEKQLVTFPKGTLDALLDEQGEKIEPSVREFFQRFLDDTEDSIDTEQLLRELIDKYNTVAKLFRQKS